MGAFFFALFAFHFKLIRRFIQLGIRISLIPD